MVSHEDPRRKNSDSSRDYDFLVKSQDETFNQSLTIDQNSEPATIQEPENATANPVTLPASAQPISEESETPIKTEQCQALKVNNGTFEWECKNVYKEEYFSINQ